jgi:Domain of Unknown Function (DUF1080)
MKSSPSPAGAAKAVLIAALLCGFLNPSRGQEVKDQKPVKKKSTAPPVYESGIVWPEPPRVEAEPVCIPPPSDAVVLFDGKDLSAWKGGEKWTIENGEAVARGVLTTRQTFGDCQLHVEWATPKEVRGRGQERGNNGIKMMGRYEVQILDSYDNPTYRDGMVAAIYKQRPPLVNVCRKPGAWQSYDIFFEAPRFDGGKLKRPAYITVLHNGVLVHHHVEILGATAYDRPPRYTVHAEKGPVLLAYHGSPVRFRNLWIREIKPLEGKRP